MCQHVRGLQLRSLEPVIPGGHVGLPGIPAAGGGVRDAPEKDVLKIRLAMSAISVSSGFDWEICPKIIYQLRMIPDTNFWLPYSSTDTREKEHHHTCAISTNHAYIYTYICIQPFPHRQKMVKEKQNKTFNVK